jgi:hypothetical protein
VLANPPGNWTHLPGRRVLIQPGDKTVLMPAALRVRVRTRIMNWEGATMSDANVRIPEEAKDRLAAIAAAEGLSLRAYLAHLAETLLTPAERAERAEKALTALKEWNGYAPTEAQKQALDDELDRRLAQVTAR